MNKLKVKAWNEEEASEILKQRLENDKKYRESKFERQWKANESLLFSSGKNELNPTLSYSSLSEVMQMQSTQQTNIHIPHVAKNLRFLHSQMSANPPSVMPVATSNELSDRKATDAASDLITYGRKQYKLQEYTDLTTLSTLTYGSGIVKTYHDPHAGKILKFDKKSDEITMTGDFKVRPMLIWDIWFDKDATCWDDVRYGIERRLIPMEQANSIWPEQQDVLMAHRVNSEDHPSKIGTSGMKSTISDPSEDTMNSLAVVYEYTEKGLPENGMAGRRCFFVEDGTILGKLEKNPNPEAILPYAILTDIDVPGEVYGKTTVDYALSLAKVVDSLDTMVLDNIELHGSIKLVVFDQSETNEDNYSDNPVDIITVNGTHAHAPFQMKPATVSGDIYAMRAQMIGAIDDVMGVNEILQGQINRELSGFASQTAINAANMVRHRLFNKYTSFVEFIYNTFLMSVQQNWKTKRTIEVVGPENESAVKYIEGADIKGGYTLTVEYGTNFSLDPATRREEIMQAKDVLIEGGVSPRKIAQMLKYNEVAGLFDVVSVASKRQMEIFEEAIERFEKTGKAVVESASVMRKAYHLEMAEAATEFVMTKDFLNLNSKLREAIYKHIDEREALAAETAAPPAPEGGMAPPGMAPAAAPAGMPPMPDIGGVL